MLINEESLQQIIYNIEHIGTPPFCIWDPYFMILTVDFHGIPCEEYINEASETVDGIYAQLFA
jgi:hypothetical protein